MQVTISRELWKQTRQNTKCDICSTQSSPRYYWPEYAPIVLFKNFVTQIQPIIDYSSEVCYDRKVTRRYESLQAIY